jgi:hypothetical protein
MNYIWYEPIVEALRHHIEANHMNEKYALDELKFTEEHLAYSKFGDEENISIGCPWSIHCNCEWEYERKVILKLVVKEE